MKPTKDKSWARLVTLALAALTLAACGTPATTRFYTLANSAKTPVTAAPAATSIAIEVLPINMPERLKRPQLVVSKQGSTELRILEQDRWSSAFQDELRDALAGGVASQLGATDVSRGGRVARQPVYRIAVALRQFDALPGDKIQAGFGWTVTRLMNASSPSLASSSPANSSTERSMSCQLTLLKPVGSSTDSLVKGVQAAVADLVMAISANITALNAGENVDSGTGECGSLNN